MKEDRGRIEGRIAGKIKNYMEVTNQGRGACKRQRRLETHAEITAQNTRGNYSAKHIRKA